MTALRTLEDASQGKVVARFETYGGDIEPTVRITVLDKDVAERSIEASQSFSDQQHGLIMEIKGAGTTLKKRGSIAYFSVDELADPLAAPGLHEQAVGIEPSLKAIFHWAGQHGYIKRPRVFHLVQGS